MEITVQRRKDRCQGIFRTIQSWCRGIVVSRPLDCSVFGAPGFWVISGCTLATRTLAGEGNSAIGLGFASTGAGTDAGGEADLVKNNDAPSSSLVMFSIFSFFFIIQKAH